jgi:site-specific recombinase XerD
MNKDTTTLQSLLENWFVKWLISHRKVSECTVQSYRDTFKLLFRWLKENKGINPDKADFDDIDRKEILGFLEYLSTERECTEKTINCRMCSIKSFAEYVATESPEHVRWSASIRSIKNRSEAKPVLEYLTPSEVDTLVRSCDRTSADGRRDAMMVQLMFNSGFRVSELVGIKISLIVFNSAGTCRITVFGKGRKERTIPLWRSTTSAIKSYLDETGFQGDQHLFPGRNTDHLTRSGARSRLDSIFERATQDSQTLSAKKITLHSLRNSTAMAMLDAGIDISTIAIWLGHEQIQTTHKYMVASLEMKERALEKASLSNPFMTTVSPRGRYKADSKLLAFLETL